MRPIAVILAAALAVHASSLWSFFSLDDVLWFLRIKSGASLVSGNRPAFQLVLEMLHNAAGLTPWPYFAVNLLLHGLNGIGFYSLCTRLGVASHTALFGALIFVVSPIAFTPLHWAVGLADLLACGLAIIASHFLIGAWKARSLPLLGAACGLGVAAVMAKESAIAWSIFATIVVLPTKRPRFIVLPAAVLVVSVAWTLWRLAPFRRPLVDAYSPVISLDHVLGMAVTYLAWPLMFLDPLPDQLATAARHLWPLSAIVVAVCLTILYRARGPSRRIGMIAVLWFAAWILPALTIQQAYLYYTYTAWLGGSLIIALGTSGFRSRLSRYIAWGGLIVYAAWSAAGVAARERVSARGLPLDPVMRQSMLIRNVLHSLSALRIEEGSAIGFVNPRPGPRADLSRRDRVAGGVNKRSYYPLESVLLDGRTLELFGMNYRVAGFSDTIPASWDSVRILLFEQRGYVRDWGHGDSARAREREWMHRLQ